MAESKRIFNQAKMNRDIDDRLLPEGSYRYANNVNIGESEGGDIGAVENLKGNHIVGDDVIGGTTIGVVRDPNNDRVYFFNKGTEFDTIYEYDESLGTVVPILKDSVDRDLVKPTCTPDFTTFVNDPDGDDNNRPTPSFSYKMPVEGCMDSTATNYNPAATYTDTTVCQFAPAGCNDPAASNYIPGSDGSVACTYPPTGVPFTFASTGPACSLIPAGGSTDMLSDGYITVTTGTIQSITPNTQAENTGASLITGITFSVNVTGTIPTGQNFLNEGTPFNVTGDVECSQSGTVAPEKFTWGFDSGGTTAVGTQVHGAEDGIETIEGDVYTPVGVSMVTINNPTTMRWATPPTATISGNPGTVGISAVAPTQDDIDNGTVTTAANVSLTGNYTVTKDEFATITWSGGTIEAIPSMFTGSVAISTWPDYIIFSSGGQTLGTSEGSDQATYTFSNLPAGVFSFNAAIAWSSPSLGVEFFLEDRAISTVLGNPTTAGFNITFPPGTPTTFSETLTADIVITVNGGIFDGEEVTITSGATQTSQFA